MGSINSSRSMSLESRLPIVDWGCPRLTIGTCEEGDTVIARVCFGTSVGPDGAAKVSFGSCEEGDAVVARVWFGTTVGPDGAAEVSFG
jgi:hypothetical protein